MARPDGISAIGEAVVLPRSTQMSVPDVVQQDKLIDAQRSKPVQRERFQMPDADLDGLFPEDYTELSNQYQAIADQVAEYQRRGWNLRNPTQKEEWDAINDIQHQINTVQQRERMGQDIFSRYSTLREAVQKGKFDPGIDQELQEYRTMRTQGQTLEDRFAYSLPNLKDRTEPFDLVDVVAKVQNTIPADQTSKFWRGKIDFGTMNVKEVSEAKAKIAAGLVFNEPGAYEHFHKTLKQKMGGVEPSYEDVKNYAMDTLTPMFPYRQESGTIKGKSGAIVGFGIDEETANNYGKLYVRQFGELFSGKDGVFGTPVRDTEEGKVYTGVSNAFGQMYFGDNKTKISRFLRKDNGNIVVEIEREVKREVPDPLNYGESKTVTKTVTEKKEIPRGQEWASIIIPTIQANHNDKQAGQIINAMVDEAEKAYNDPNYKLQDNFLKTAMSGQWTEAQSARQGQPRREREVSYTRAADGKYYAYPTSFQDESGELQKLNDDEALQEAERRGEVTVFESEREAQKFAKGGLSGTSVKPSTPQEKKEEAAKKAQQRPKNSGTKPGGRMSQFNN